MTDPLSHARITALCKVLSDETRLRIVEMLTDRELCACDILEAFDISQPTLSYHMKALSGSGLVRARKDGAWMRYTLNRDLLTDLSRHLGRIADATSDGRDAVCGFPLRKD